MNKSTISREINCNSINGYYSPKSAHIQSVSRDTFKPRYKNSPIHSNSK
ncbi:hypothetical protein [Arcobacter sp. 15-2]